MSLSTIQNYAKFTPWTKPEAFLKPLQMLVSKPMWLLFVGNVQKLGEEAIGLSYDFMVQNTSLILSICGTAAATAALSKYIHKRIEEEFANHTKTNGGEDVTDDLNRMEKLLNEVKHLLEQSRNNGTIQPLAIVQHTNGTTGDDVYNTGYVSSSSIMSNYSEEDNHNNYIQDEINNMDVDEDNNGNNNTIAESNYANENYNNDDAKSVSSNASSINLIGETNDGEDNNIDAKSVSSLSDITDDGTPSRSVSPKSVKNTTLHGACRRSKRQRYQTREHVLTNMTPAQQKTWEKAQLESLKAEKQRKRRKLVVTSDEENSGVIV